MKLELNLQIMGFSITRMLNSMKLDVTLAYKDLPSAMDGCVWNKFQIWYRVLTIAPESLVRLFLGVSP